MCPAARWPLWSREKGGACGHTLPARVVLWGRGSCHSQAPSPLRPPTPSLPDVLLHPRSASGDRPPACRLGPATLDLRNPAAVWREGLGMFFFPSLFYLLENFLFLLEYNCFPMLHAFLLYREGSQLHVYMYPLRLESSSRPPVELRAELPALCTAASRSLSVTHSSGCVSDTPSSCPPSIPAPHPTMSTGPFSASASLFLP